jgi:hypothetical protein
MEGSFSISALMDACRRSLSRLSDRPEFGPATALFTISTEARAVIHSLLGFDVPADGSRFVIVKAAQSPSLVVVQNWQALLDKH